MIDQEAEKYLDELAADIVEKGGLNGKSIMEVMQEAHDRRQAFAQEVLDNKTDRAKMARKAIGANIWINVQAERVKQSVLFDCHHIAAGH